MRNFGTIATSFQAIFLSGDLATITNSGQVSGQTTLLVTGVEAYVANSGQVFASFQGISVTGLGARVINSGLIASDNVGINLQPFGGSSGMTSRVTNSGDILTTGIGIDFANLIGVVHNVGRIISTDAAAIESPTALTLVNRGLIAGGTETSGNGIALALGGSTDVIRNFGTITGSVLTGAGNDVVRNNGDIQREVNLGAGSDLYLGSLTSGDATVNGGDQRDVILSGAGDDVISGGNGDDDLRGGAGDDLIYGGAGFDALAGGAGSDIFVLASAADIGLGPSHDRITDFKAGVDVIDFGVFMLGGSFIAAAAFSAAGQVRYTVATGTLQGDVDGDGLADWTLTLSNQPSLTAGDLDF